ncbi:hypothetical protein [Advenella sp. FME57]|uniref:hypothetical protein n=1 Tax=Advenella sp. FME57 TaxID=2742604 RepID=UPI0018690363|nr:hypothetical protein [Advenella sp. FME57]
MDFEFNIDRASSAANVYFKYHFCNIKKPLVITFANLGELIDEAKISEYPSPWGFEFVKRKGLNVLSFASCRPSNWYRKRAFPAFLRDLSANLPDFPERLGYGGSMGGYGVSAFANILRMNRVLLMNPISTLNDRLVPWETRFPGGRSLSWKYGVFDGSKMNCPGYVVYDPLFKLDRLHALRYKKNIVHLKIPGVGHSTPTHLQTMKLLSPLFQAFVDGDIDCVQFHESVRKRRNIVRYYDEMLNEEFRTHTETRRRIIQNRKNQFLQGQINSPQNITIERKFADTLRDSARLLEDIDIHKALKLMELAYQIRQGTFIEKKIKQYRKIAQK